MNLKKKFILISKKIFVKKLISGKSNNCGGRSFTGKIVVRGRANLKKFKKRLISSFNLFFGLNLVLSFEYDPSRNTLIYLAVSKIGCAFYSLAIENLMIGNVIFIGYKVPRVLGNVTLLKNLKKSSIICNLQKSFRKKTIFLKSSGMYGKLVKKNKLFSTIKIKTYKRFLKINTYS
jgi:ribosomal protein L2